MFPLLVLASLAVLKPGDLLTVEASCKVSDQPNVTASCSMIVSSPLPLTSPIFLAKGWDSSNHMADGLWVRAFVKDSGKVCLKDGIQMSDGRIWAGGLAYERCEPVTWSELPEGSLG
jgi:hypothetical protein